ncbi:phage/plasmid primase, P4 family [Micromonospora sp. LOL_024]|uniref:DNA primase family protein n=1 Tax=Micromonospora sp. LOL_024 TaxID=3345412 RepID=UPI003A85CF59
MTDVTGDDFLDRIEAAGGWVDAAEEVGVTADEPPPDDEDTTLYPAPYEPLPVARRLLIDRQVDGVLTIRRWRGGWMVWLGPAWAETEQGAVGSWVWGHLEYATYLDVNVDPPKVKPWRPNSRRISDVTAALSAATYLSDTVQPPMWAAKRAAMGREDTLILGASFPSSNGSWTALDLTGPSKSGNYISTANGLLNIATRELRPHTPEFFNLVSVPFDYDPDAPTPQRWLKFLAELWPDDPDSVSALQEFFGYVLSGRTDLHKILLVVGPPRGGKGTIARILTALVGKGSMAGPTLASLNTNFGLAPLLGKPLAIISDARLAGKDSHQVVERLLTISGEDTLTVDRKNRDAWTGQLPTRLVILSNELPSFGDSSGAIATRFVTLVLANSWLGSEDVNLGRDLNAELPGILNWALDGLERIRATNRITEPESSREAIMAMMDQASPMSAFVREVCETGPMYEIPVDELWDAWKEWGQENGRDKPGTKQAFGRNLRAVVPGVRRFRPRDGDSRQPTYVGIRLSQESEKARSIAAQADHTPVGQGKHAGATSADSRPTAAHRAVHGAAPRSDEALRELVDELAAPPATPHHWWIGSGPDTPTAPTATPYAPRPKGPPDDTHTGPRRPHDAPALSRAGREAPRPQPGRPHRPGRRCRRPRCHRHGGQRPHSARWPRTRHRPGRSARLATRERPRRPHHLGNRCWPHMRPQPRPKPPPTGARRRVEARPGHLPAVRTPVRAAPRFRTGTDLRRLRPPVRRPGRRRRHPPGHGAARSTGLPVRRVRPLRTVLRPMTGGPGPGSSRTGAGVDAYGTVPVRRSGRGAGYEHRDELLAANRALGAALSKLARDSDPAARQAGVDIAVTVAELVRQATVAAGESSGRSRRAAAEVARRLPRMRAQLDALKARLGERMPSGEVTTP